jgi:hypothetical protein
MEMVLKKPSRSIRKSAKTYKNKTLFSHLPPGVAARAWEHLSTLIAKKGDQYVPSKMKGILVATAIRMAKQDFGLIRTQRELGRRSVMKRRFRNGSLVKLGLREKRKVLPRNEYLALSPEERREFVRAAALSPLQK